MQQPDQPLPTRDRDAATDRRAVLAKLAKGAAYAAPATLALLSMTEQAVASA